MAGSDGGTDIAVLRVEAAQREAAPPAQTTNAEIVWRHRRLGEMTLPVLQRDEFLKKLKLHDATLAVNLREHTVACQVFVSTQCRGLLASGVLTSPTSLVALADLGLHVEFRAGKGDGAVDVPVRLSSSQLKHKQALVTVTPARLQRAVGSMVVSWKIDDRVLASFEAAVGELVALGATRHEVHVDLADTAGIISWTINVAEFAANREGDGIRRSHRIKDRSTAGNSSARRPMSSAFGLRHNHLDR